jgi:hypothetical protein
MKGKYENEIQFTDPGHCMSAAALAFLGGEFRFVSENSKYGVHRFSLGEQSSRGVDDAQVLSASVVEYIRSMDVATELFSISSEVPVDDILELPPGTLRRLKIANDGIKPAKWSIESLEGVLYLKGERDTVCGMQKFLLVFPARGRMYMHVIFDVGKVSDDILKMGTDRLSIDGNLVPLQDLRIQRFSDNNRINLMYHVTPEILSRLKSAKWIVYHLK